MNMLKTYLKLKYTTASSSSRWGVWLWPRSGPAAGWKGPLYPAGAGAPSSAVSPGGSCSPPAPAPARPRGDEGTLGPQRRARLERCGWWRPGGPRSSHTPAPHTRPGSPCPGAGPPETLQIWDWASGTPASGAGPPPAAQGPQGACASPCRRRGRAHTHLRHTHVIDWLVLFNAIRGGTHRDPRVWFVD